MSEQEERRAIISTAPTWVCTPFAWEACIKGKRGGVDCGRFLAGVFNEAGVKDIDVSKFARRSPQWFLHRSNESYLDDIRQFTVEYELQPGQKPQPGDIIVAEYGRDWAHSAIVLQWPKVIGSAVGFCVCIWQNIYTSPQYAQRRLRFFNPWAPGAGKTNRA